MLYLWLAGLVLLATGIVGVWYTVTKTEYLPKLALWLVQQMLPVIMKRKPPELEAKWRQAVRQAQEWDHRTNKPRDSK